MNNPVEKWAEEMNTHPDGQQTHEKRCSTALIIRECKSKLWEITTHLSECVNKINTRNEHWQECKEKGTLVHGCWECKLVQPLRKTVWSFLQKLKMGLPYNPAIVLLGVYQKNIKRLIQRDTRTLMLTARSTISNSQTMEAAQVSIDWWMDEEVVYIYTMEYYSVIQKKEILPFAMAWMELESMILSEISQLERDKYHVISLKCGM